MKKLYLLKTTFLFVTIMLFATDSQSQTKKHKKPVKKQVTKWPKQYWDSVKINNFISFVKKNGIYQNGSYQVTLENGAIFTYDPPNQTIAVDNVVIHYKMDKYFTKNSIDGKLFATIPFMEKNHYIKDYILLAVEDVYNGKIKIQTQATVTTWRESKDQKDSLFDRIRYYIETHGTKLVHGYLYQANGITFQYDVSETQTSFFLHDSDSSSMQLVVNNTSTIENTGWLHYKNGERKISITDLESVYNALIIKPKTYTDQQVKKHL